MSMLDKEKFYDVGEPENYHSIYGYAKKRYPVFEVNEDGARVGNGPLGTIKEEIGLDEQGNPTHRTFYAKNMGRSHGQYRFYPTMRALLVAMGGKVRPKQELPKVVTNLEDLPSIHDGILEPEPSPIEARLKALEEKVFVGPAKPRRKAAAKKAPPKKKVPVKKPAKRVKKLVY